MEGALVNVRGLAETALGFLKEAETSFRRALGIWEKAFGPDHPDVAIVLENYTVLLRKLDRITEAESMETRAQAIQKRLASQK